MLSAVAARKAAKAAAEAAIAASSKPTPAPAPAPSPPPKSSPPPAPSPPPKPTADKWPSSKRRSRSATNPGPSKNKKSKVAHAPDRYFDTPKAQTENENAVDETDSDSDSDSSSGEEVEIEVDVPPPAITITKTNRAWSPSRPVVESSSEEDETVLPSPTKIPEPSRLCTFSPAFDVNIYPVPDAASGTVIMVLQPNETVALVGTYFLRVLQGSLSLLGVTLSPSDTKHTVFAPRSSPIPILSWAPSDSQGACTFPVPQVIQQQPNATAIAIEEAHTGVEGLGRICRTFENAFKRPRELEAIPSVALQGVYFVDRGTKDVHPFVLPSSWGTALASIEERHPDSGMNSPPICLVKGPKKSGKSTLARTLMNRLLTRYRRVAFLECDLGQSEFTPGGLVALNLVENFAFGPPFTHPSLPYRAHYIGSTSPRASPSHYLHSIQSLLETYKLELQFLVSIEDSPGDERIHDAIPLVVNTMGWTKGLGADLNSRIEEFIEASHTFEIDGAEERGWPSLPQPEPVSQLRTALSFAQPRVRRCIKVEPIRSEMTTTYYTATDHRHVNVMSYFHAVFPEPPTYSLPKPGQALKQMTATSWETSVPLCARYPYEVDYTQAFDHVYLTGQGYEDVVPPELTRVLNGAIVGLVSTDSTDSRSRPIQSTSQETPSLPYTPAEPPPDPTLSTCHGLALVRGIPISPDPRSPYMHLLTPLPPGYLADTRVLVKGEMELPIWGMLDFREDDLGRVAGVEKGQVPYLQWGKGEGVGAEKRRVRRNLMRKGQM